MDELWRRNYKAKAINFLIWVQKLWENFASPMLTREKISSTKYSRICAFVEMLHGNLIGFRQWGGAKKTFSKYLLNFIYCCSLNFLHFRGISCRSIFVHLWQTWLKVDNPKTRMSGQELVCKTLTNWCIYALINYIRSW